MFQKILDESNRKPNKIWVDKSTKFNNKSRKSFLLNNKSCIQHILSEKDLLGPSRMKLVNM